MSAQSNIEMLLETLERLNNAVDRLITITQKHEERLERLENVKED